MTTMTYRGVSYSPKATTQTLAEQMRKPALTYRGVEHDGERAIETRKADTGFLMYRGARFA